jgi:hypothetical protein
VIYRRQTPLIPPLSGGKWTNIRFRTLYGGFMRWLWECRGIIKLIRSKLGPQVFPPFGSGGNKAKYRSVGWAAHSSALQDSWQGLFRIEDTMEILVDQV